MEKYESPNMEIVELENDVILTSLCNGTEDNEMALDFPSGCTEDPTCAEEF